MAGPWSGDETSSVHPAVVDRRQPEDELGTAVMPVRAPDPSAMVADRLGHDAQTESTARACLGATGASEPLEDPVAVLGRHARPVGPPHGRRRSRAPG